MKAWKMAGCLLLLAVIICGCAVLGQAVEVSAEQPGANESGDASTNFESSPAPEE
ncbi:MAG: hypothetical protein IJW22_03805 [Clostridia bacterium]|nr:hypothetical protein [Clostridia bacterium]